MLGEEEQHKLTVMLVEMSSKIETLLDKQEELADNINQIKEAVYNPDSGLYARLRELEQWKESQAKVQWTIITTVIGLVAATLYKMITSA